MPSDCFLLTGAAGYVGSHVLRLFLEQGQKCVVLDDLSKGHRLAVPSGVPFYQANISDENVLDEIFKAHTIAGVLHFAGFIEVGESMQNPAKYFENNLFAAIPLLEKVKTRKNCWIVFSSSAAVYGEPKQTPIHEHDPKNPNNPYGLTKWMFEEMLRAYDHSFGIRSISLRYFNAAGAHPAGDIGEDHAPESHLIPLVCQTALGKKDKIQIYGDDYPTQDGTCVRDYIHILDLAKAHWIAASSLQKGDPTKSYNLGNEKGYSVKEVIETVRRVTGKKINQEIAPRRKGDSAVLVASSKAFREEHGWKPEFETLEKIVESAWLWHHRHPDGF